MKSVTILLIAITTLLSGCVVYDTPHRDGDRRGEHRSERDRDRDGIPDRVDRDRDNDGVSNRRDRRPSDPSRY
jgi:hypothetical protein